MTTRVILQARMSSSRLPGKSLLKLAGVPLAILAARRAASSDLSILLATSTAAEDDPLEAAARAWEVPVFRGPLDDVLSRYILASSDLEDDDIVVRLTCDDPLPDGPFVDELVAQMLSQSLDYLGPKHPDDGLPYGLVAEAARVRALRDADRLTLRAEDREHVTPYLRRRYDKFYFRPRWSTVDRKALRCTIDTREDYERMASLFHGIDDPLTRPAVDLVRRLALQEERAVMVGADASEERLLALSRAGLRRFVIRPDSALAAAASIAAPPHRLALLIEPERLPTLADGIGSEQGGSALLSLLIGTLSRLGAARLDALLFRSETELCAASRAVRSLMGDELIGELALFRSGTWALDYRDQNDDSLLAVDV